MGSTISVSDKLVLSVTEAAAMLSVSKPTMYEIMRRDGFPRLRVGKRTLIPRQGLEAWVLEQTSMN